MKRYQHGGGLVEGLVSLTILSVGLLGMAGMQGTLIQEGTESRSRMQAGFLASSVLGMAAANPERVKELQAAWGEWNKGNVPPLWGGKQ